MADGDRTILISVNSPGCRVPGTGPILQNSFTDTINELKDTGSPKPAFWFLARWRPRLSGADNRSKLDSRRQPLPLRVIVGTMLTQKVFSEINSAVGRDSTA